MQYQLLASFRRNFAVGLGNEDGVSALNSYPRFILPSGCFPLVPGLSFLGTGGGCSSGVNYLPLSI